MAEMATASRFAFRSRRARAPAPKPMRLVAIWLASLGAAPALAHLLEMPAKLRYDGALWVTLLHTLYPAFGTLGAVFEVGALAAVLLLAWLLRGSGPAFRWTAIGAACLVAAHAAFWIWVAPVNAALGGTSPDALPENWMRLRAQWEYTHAVRALLQIGAVGALLQSLLVEIPPARPERTREGRTP